MKKSYLILLILIGFSCNNKKANTDLKEPKEQVELKADSQKEAKINDIETENLTNKIKNIDSTLIRNVALDFINSYVENCNKMREQIGIIEWVSAQQNVTENFKSELNKIITEAEKQDPELGLGFDPIFDAQDYPDNGFELNKSNNSKSELITVIGKDWNNFKRNIKMEYKNERWLVNGVGIINMTEKERIER